jgi:FlaG/FlaF family flagellin (archaellin)
MKVILKGTVVLAGVVLATAFGGTVVASAASPSSTLTVQDGGNTDGDGAVVDADGTQGTYKPALDGTETGPMMVGTPQDTTH